MDQFLQTEKVKKNSGFHNFFLGAILLHLVLFVALNIRKAVRLDVSKEAFLKFTMIKLPPSQEPEIRPEIQPQKTEVKVDAPKIKETELPKASMEVEDIKPMDAVQVEERDLLREKLGSFEPPDQMEEASGGTGGINESESNIDLPASFGRPNEVVSSEGRGPAWGSGGGSGGGAGKGTGGPGGFGSKKDVQRFSYGQMAFKQLVSGLPDWVEKSNKVIITTVRVWINPEGKVTKTEIAKSSGYMELDQLALDSMKKRIFKASTEGSERIALIEIDFTNIR